MPTIELRKISKRFGGVKALTDVSLTIRPGEVLALVGENGAGKSTLMKVLSGVIPFGDFEGQILIDGKEQDFRSPSEADKAGIAIIHQELASFPQLTVAENIFLGHWPLKNGLIHWEKMNVEAEQWLQEIGADVSALALMSTLSTGSRQLVEIAKAISRKATTLILDEPTSSLTPGETKKLFAVMDRLKSKNTALVYISHKMEEIFALATRVAVLRDGSCVFESLAGETDEARLISLMVGRPLNRLFPEKPSGLIDTVSSPVLEARDFAVEQHAGRDQIGPLSFTLRPGEILGFAGLLGAGRSEIFEALLGGYPRSHRSGTVLFKGEVFSPGSPREGLRGGIGLIGEERKRDSLFAQRSLEENVSISRLASGCLARILNRRTEQASAQSRLESLHTRFNQTEQKISDLSGGNQQKVILGRLLEIAPDVLVLDEPTRGVDVGAKYEIYQMIFELTRAGKGLIVISSDLPELMALSDRIIVMSLKRYAGELQRSEFTQERVMELAIRSSESSRHSKASEPISNQESLR
jgi:D-xylose transport system ATP-binding protein